MNMIICDYIAAALYWIAMRHIFFVLWPTSSPPHELRRLSNWFLQPLSAAVISNHARVSSSEMNGADSLALCGTRVGAMSSRPHTTPHAGASPAADDELVVQQGLTARRASW